MKIKFLFAALLASGLVLSTNAQTIHQSQKNQERRIKEGVKSGELTKKEAKELKDDHKKIKADVAAAKADGVVTKQERKEIKKEQKKESKKIFNKKHNAQDRN